MTTQQVADRFNEMAQAGEFNKIQDELFAKDAESVEPANDYGLPTVKGLDAIREKGKKFSEGVEKMIGGYSSAPVVGGNYFSVGMGMECMLKNGRHVKMDEVVVYEVKNGKIAKEQFFY